MRDEFKTKFKLYSGVAITAILFYFILLRFESVKIWFSGTISLLSPFIIGFVIAFLLDKPMMKLHALFVKAGLKKSSARTLAAILALILGILVVLAFFAILLPQLGESIVSLARQAPDLIKNFIASVERFIADNNIDMNLVVDTIFKNLESQLMEWGTAILSTSLPQVFQIGTQVTSTIINTLVGLVAGLYLMLEKENFMYGLKRVVYAIFNQDHADHLCRFSKISADIFNNFIIGKAIDSLIIGIITYIAMTIFQMPYALLLSVIVGVTNMIPVFGPFIGAIPGIFILTIMDWHLGLYFALMILAIQQFDGNILGPIILGDKLGLPSFAILFSVVVFGGLFGFLGMFIGVPIFAVIYTAVNEWVEYRLKKKNIEI